MKKALIITYYWPPMGGGGVQRWLKFAKYMRNFDWEPVIYTPKNADIANFDPSLESQIPNNIEVIRTDIWEPFDAYKKVLGKSKDEKIQPGFLQESNSNTILQEISVWIRGNLFIPDAKKYWIKPSVSYLKNYLKSNDIDVVISTGPPHTNHLIALDLKRELGMKWLADFRDPWTNIDYYSKLMLSSWADKKHRKLEKSVVLEADEVVTVSWSWADDFAGKCGRKPIVITNGYDPDDFSNGSYNRDSKQLTITHIGSLNSDRNPHGFWKALAEAIKENRSLRDIKIEFIGPTDRSVFEEANSLG
ncbi:MAG TPA: glycosyl transferase family 1 [Flavobacteriales bacterium]|nr:glycosyl transferase family 1 [Flavobacteriales bacterium]